MLIDYCQFKHDSNLTITILLKVFLKIKIFNTLYILWWWLWQLKHTNAPTIQGKLLCSMNLICWSHNYYNNIVPLELKSVIQQSYSPRPETYEIDEVYDVMEWMKPHTPNLHDHLKVHQFKFERNEHGHTKMFYKEWSTDPFWLPHSGISLLISHSFPIPQELMLIFVC